jgi:flagellar biosynthetic protein FliO
VSIHRARRPMQQAQGRPSNPMIRVVVVVIVVFGFLTGPVTWGAEDSSSANTWLSDPNGLLSQKGGVTGELILKTTASLVAVLGLGVAAAYLLRRVGPRLCRIPGKEIRIIETTALGPKKALHIVEVGPQRFLIGSTSEQVTLLSPIGPFPSQERPPSVDPGRGL